MAEGVVTANSDMPEIKIVKLVDCPQHIPKLSQIWHGALGEAWGPEYPLERMEQILYEQLNVDQIPLALAAVLDDEPVGMCCIRTSDDIKPYLVPTLGSVCVRNDLRNKGVGALLVEAAIKKTAELGFARLYLFTVDMTIFKWYEQFGFYTLGVRQWDNGSTSMLMELVLSGREAAA